MTTRSGLRTVAGLGTAADNRRTVLKGVAGSALGFAAMSTGLPLATAQVASPAAAPAALLGAPGELTIYSGRSEDLIAGVIDIIESDGEIDAQVSYGSTGEIAIRILEEGTNSPASLFIAQDAGALGQLANEGRLAPLPAEILDRVDPRFVSPDGLWVGLSARARVLVYNTDIIAEADLPASLVDLTDESWSGQVAWAPTNASFQSHVTALRQEMGEDATREWLQAMIDNGTVAYEGNAQIVTAVCAGEIATGLVNHYYLWEKIAEEGEQPAANYYFPDGDVGALVNIAGAGVLAESPNPEQALRALDVLLGTNAQTYFAENTSEYPLIAGVEPRADLPPLADIETPDIDLTDLADLEGTVALLTEVGLL
ncbi:MAG: iron ABC transporter substrate-binding protein [Chloroflexota bacterium]|nr:iron ABC transporter substrate-binding protein [Chloroflexota bacterium]